MKVTFKVSFNVFDLFISRSPVDILSNHDFADAITSFLEERLGNDKYGIVPPSLNQLGRFTLGCYNRKYDDLSYLDEHQDNVDAVKKYLPEEVVKVLEDLDKGSWSIIIGKDGYAQFKPQ